MYYLFYYCRRVIVDVRFFGLPAKYYEHAYDQKKLWLINLILVIVNYPRMTATNDGYIRMKSEHDSRLLRVKKKLFVALKFGKHLAESYEPISLQWIKTFTNRYRSRYLFSGVHECLKFFTDVFEPFLVLSSEDISIVSSPANEQTIGVLV